MMHEHSQNLMKKHLSAKDQFLTFLAGKKFGTILADPPWQFQNRTGKIAPEHRRLSQYGKDDSGRHQDTADSFGRCRCVLP